jgi:hypothetical protein
MSYRTRVHSITGNTPFYLMFGREMLTFEDWSHEKDVNDILAIENRTIEIKNHFEQTIPATVEILESKKDKQNEIQNQVNNVLTKHIDVGTTVYVKNEGLLSKLDQRFLGPFTIDSITKNGNYKLKNTENLILDKSYPLEKLKITKDTNDSDEIFAVEKIIDDRVFRRQQQYLVKWKNFPETDNSWEKESNFVSMKPIKIYWDLKKSKNETKPIRTSKRLEKINLLRVISSTNICLYTCIFLFLFFMAEFCSSQNIQSTFKFCDISSNMRKINFLNACRQPFNKKFNNISAQLIPKDTLITNLNTFVILSKLSHEVSGTGFECYLEKYTIQTFMGFFLEISQIYKTESISVSSNECWKMVRSRKCRDKEMTCDGHTCYYKASIQASYKWLHSLTFEDYNCHVTPRIISATRLNDTLFNSAFPACRASDLYCSLHDHTIVWQSDVIHTCPFEIVTTSSLVAVLQNVFLSREDHLAFQLTDIEYGCRIPLAHTNEGLYIAHVSYADRFRPSEKTLKDIQDLALADEDYVVSKNFELFGNVDRALCHQIITTIKLFAKLENEFLKIYDRKNNPIILYTKNQIVYIPACIIIKEITIVSNTRNCYADIPIQLQFKNETKNAFLRHDNIITKTSKYFECELIKSFVNIENSNYSIQRSKNTNNIIQQNDQYEFLNLINTDFNYNFHHKQDIIESIDLRNIEEQFINSNEIDGNFIISTDNDRSENLLKLPAEEFQHISEQIAHKTKSFFKTIKTILLTLFLLFMLFVILVVLYCFKKPFCKIFNMLKIQFTKYFNATNIKMKELKREELKTEEQTIAHVNHQSDISTIYPALPTTTPKEDDNVSLDTKNFIINYVKQLPSSK